MEEELMLDDTPSWRVDCVPMGGYWYFTIESSLDGIVFTRMLMQEPSREILEVIEQILHEV